MQEIRVQREDFDTDAEVTRLCKGRVDIGAVVTFTGLVRDLSRGQSLQSLTLEHYPAMTKKSLRSIVAEAEQRWDLQGVCLIHRFGKLEPADRIVLVAVTSAHRRDAFHAAQFIMDYLKVSAPLWKKETTDVGERWLEARHDDERALDHWQ